MVASCGPRASSPAAVGICGRAPGGDARGLRPSISLRLLATCALSQPHELWPRAGLARPGRRNLRLDKGRGIRSRPSLRTAGGGKVSEDVVAVGGDPKLELGPMALFPPAARSPRPPRRITPPASDHRCQTAKDRPRERRRRSRALSPRLSLATIALAFPVCPGWAVGRHFFQFQRGEWLQRRLA